MDIKKASYPINDRWSYLWLAVATVVSIFSQASGRWLIPIFAWVAPIFLLRFYRSQRRGWLAYLLVAVSMAVVTFINMPTMLGTLGPPIVILVSLLFPLPYLADRKLAPHLPGFASSLVFPTAMTAFIFFSALTSPFGSSTSPPYTQYDNLVLLQLLSLTGMWGLSFVIYWLSAVVNWAWERNFAWNEIKRGALVYLGVMLLIIVYGEARLWFGAKPVETVRIAGFTMVEWRGNQPAMMEAFESDLDLFRQMMEERYQLYFEATIKEARAGAKFISYPENAMTVTPQDEPALVARLGELAKQEGIYLVAPIVEMVVDAPYANKLLIFDPQGEIVLEHYKYGGAGMEGNRINGDAILHTAQTPYGVISAVICWDTVLQGIVTQAGRSGADILFTPSLTFPETDPMFAQNSVFRGIENGVSTVHVSDMGLSVITDPYGRILASMDHYNQGERVLVAQVPTKGAWTLYPRIGDLFGWLSLAATLGLVIWGIAQAFRSRKADAARQKAQAIQ